MAQPQTYEEVYEGTPEELERYLKQQERKQRFRLVRVTAEEHRIPGVVYPTLSVEERIRAMDALAENNRHLPSLPDEAFDREKLAEGNH